MSVEMQVEALVNKVNVMEQFEQPSAEGPEGIGDRLKELIAKLMANLENIDAEEAAALLAEATAMITAFAAGRMIVGFLSFMAFMRMYRKAVASLATGTA